MRTRDRLSAEAARLFAARGYHGASVSDIASALGIKKASVYAHIAGKHDLLAEIALGGAQAFHAAQDAVPEDVGAVERIRLALLAHLGVVRTQLDFAAVWLHEWRFLEGEARKKFLDERRRYERRIRQLFADAVAAGELIETLDLDRATLVFFSIGNWAYEWLTERHDADAEGRPLATLMLDGMR